MPPSPVVSESVRSLSAAMRQDSTDQHDAAEQSPFVTELLSGRVSEQGYIAYLLRLRAIYRALEDAVREHRDDPLVGAVYDPALERLEAIDADLAHWAPGAARDVDSPAVHAYCARFADSPWGGALVAHHYTRYLGDLSGGQAIGRILGRSFDLDGEGLAFYTFPVRPKPYKDAYRDRLDGLGLDDKEIDRVVDEVKLAFGLNQSVFDELAENLPAYRR
ncbi:MULTISPECIES: heme oxygenase (biliverdin-producing) [unclassified Mycolicibacterium]|uniref:biliverdin-producing heme oxygenase n=1 Tax=unclassified Mycolicibacterium TaxID=2636767 RepID=UPI0012DFC49B|nr:MULTISPECIES: biliverdin-producing heme oxygenase [unclassified Mycolicibacterium]MUL80216.1 biliverdin-producing heme oxygenase [Mycolicibacterium sp. CBMA 329]MUL85983.1 biliverdin-producing heme oxygenase [Mycolicibacterium sp. CBMA 331]MUM00757.1 biliverdin-producing heme oxygenase [Mycolicibacterium sp. CBMA 334]MUM28182.1 biliverdin-producing heme oxygenase [Mycolicibacterium sp. CBMA 295]MUM36279.1 biliverdin-producing heme oxygenase [Mycolicibacterium sp. CBMA 247]